MKDIDKIKADRKKHLKQFSKNQLIELLINLELSLMQLVAKETK